MCIPDRTGIWTIKVFCYISMLKKKNMQTSKRAGWWWGRELLLRTTRNKQLDYMTECDICYPNLNLEPSPHSVCDNFISSIFHKLSAKKTMTISYSAQCTLQYLIKRNKDSSFDSKVGEVWWPYGWLAAWANVLIEFAAEAVQWVAKLNGKAKNSM